ncbi:MAG: mycofactocin biosynthesis peptidyl-dipeptidase MftE [Actinophytocola sp.]|nr:mycofactocin biosynthesis peptidyl-dipeptidase MftE [Actinophytocola sp.]
MNLGRTRWPDLAEGDVVLAVPLGATEQHGPHLPLDTDTTIATELCHRLASSVPGIAVAPPVPYGASGEHADFPGTLSIGQEALELLVTELVRSADAFRGVIIVNGHGGNIEPVRRAVDRLTTENRKVLRWQPSAPADDSHAGHTETSVMLRLRASAVSIDHAEPGTTETLATLIDRLRTSGIKAVSPNGVLGDPTGASPEAGEKILRLWAEDLVAAAAQWLAPTSVAKELE